MADDNQPPEVIEKVHQQPIYVQQQTNAKQGLIKDFFDILKGSWILQIGVLLVFLSVSYNIMAGGKLVMFGITIVDSIVRPDCNEQYNEHYDDGYHDGRYKNVDSLEAK